MWYLILIRKSLTTYGKPHLIVSDKRKTFWNGIDNKSQISIILNELDIQIITSSDPTSKPNVERSFSPISKTDIDKQLNLWIYRKVTNGNTISINGEHYIPIKNKKRILFKDGAKIKILSNEFKNLFVIWRGDKINLVVLKERDVTDYTSKECNKLAFEKRKQMCFNRMIDNKQLMLKKKEQELKRILALVKREREQINAY